MRHIGLKTSFRFLIAGFVVLAGAKAAQAGSVAGSQAISLASTKINTSSVATATTFTFAGLTASTPSDGDFASVPLGASLGSGPFTLTLSPLSSTFGNASFGTFVATSITSDFAFGIFRSIELAGTFTGGTMFPGLNDSAPAVLAIGLTQAGGPGRPISGSFTLDVAPVVPEPASLAMLGLGLVGIVGASRLRRKAA